MGLFVRKQAIYNSILYNGSNATEVMNWATEGGIKNIQWNAGAGLQIVSFRNNAVIIPANMRLISAGSEAELLTVAEFEALYTEAS